MRRPLEGYQSFERLFEVINHRLPDDIILRNKYLPCHTVGFFRRCANVLAALFYRGQVIHITGDVHYLLPALLGRRVVLTVHDLAAVHSNKGFKKSLIIWFQYRIPLSLATVTTVISQAVKEELVTHIGANSAKLRVIPNCIQTQFKTVTKSWPKCPVILMVGTKPNKNLSRMLSALKGLEVEIRIVGKLDPAQHRTLTEIGTPFQPLGRLSDEAIIEAYSECDLLAFASTYEGFGLPVVEAQAVGRPVLTSDLPVLREVAGEGGGCFVDPFEIDSIRAGFLRLIEDQTYRENLVGKGMDNAKRFSPEATAAAYAAVYREVADGLRIEPVPELPSCPKG
jgi:glycosyltransferase involved in cell wall biosynthesis